MRLSLEGRSELKYALPVSRRGEVMAAAKGHVVVGAHTHSLADTPEVAWDRSDPEPYGYRVHSLYLDSPRLDGYGRRLAEADIRNRVRIRTYGVAGDDSRVFLEAKRKLHERVVKHRVAVGGVHAWAAEDSVEPWVSAVGRLKGRRDQRLAQRWVAAVLAEEMIPACMTHYVREVYEDGTARLTLDHHVRGSHGGDPRQLHRPGEVTLLPPDWMVLELKFNGTEPGWMHNLLRVMRLASEPVSKFALAVVRTVRQDRPIELHYLTPPSLERAGRGYFTQPLVGAAR